MRRAAGGPGAEGARGAAEGPSLREAREREGVPKYLQLAAILREKIVRQEYLPDAQLPTEEQLGREYGVSRITVRGAIDRLAQDGLVLRRQGKGTYALPRKLRRDIARVYSFSQDMADLGLVPSSRTLEQRVEQADPETSALLRLPEDQRRVTRIRRLRLANGAPILLETTLVPLHLCRRLPRAELERGSLYAVLTEEYGLFPRSAEETYEAVVLAPADARLLECRGRGPHPAFAIQRVAQLEDGTPVELTRSIGRGDRLTLVIRMVADQAAFRRRVGV